jgi:hypothetical protein
MAFTARVISDRVVVGDDIFIMEDLGGGKVRLTPAPNSVSNVGTAINKALLQPIDNELASLGTAAKKNVGDNEGDIPQLGAGGKIASSHIPSLAITHTFVVNSQDAMLALGSQGAEQGDVCKREDLGQSYILTTDDPTDISAWVLLTNSPTTDIVTEGTANAYFTAERAVKAINDYLTDMLAKFNPNDKTLKGALDYIAGVFNGSNPITTLKATTKVISPEFNNQ